jgi:hypothetical protein
MPRLISIILGATLLAPALAKQPAKQLTKSTLSATQ